MKRQRTRVVNLNQRDRYDVYIGRAGRGENGYFGNPFSAGDFGRTVALSKFQAYFLDRVVEDDNYRERVRALSGKRLGCFCRPRAGFQGLLLCHGQIIAAWVDGVEPKDVE